MAGTLSDNVRPMLEPNATVIRSWLDRMFGRAAQEYPDGLVEIAWSNPSGAVNSANSFPITPEGLDRATALAVEKNREQRNLYFGVNPRKPETPIFGRGKAEDVEIAFFNFIDCDKAEATERVQNACTVPYTFAATTGRHPTPRPHCYWELETPSRNLAAWSAQQKALADHFKGDAVIDSPRIMRLPGTINYPTPKKIERGYRVEMVTFRTVYEDGQRSPVGPELLAAAYRPAPVEQPAFDPETGEVYDYRPAGTSGTTGSLGLNLGRHNAEHLINEIRAGRDWHNNAIRLVAHLVSTGSPDAVILGLAETLTLNGYTVDATKRDLAAMIRGARVKWNVPNQDEAVTADDGLETSNTIGIEPLSFDDAQVNTIPPRPWLFGTWLLKRYVTLLIAPPGVGKSTLTIQMNLAIAAGRDWAGQRVHEDGPAWVFNNEDDQDELDRRIFAAIAEMGIDRAALKGRFFRNSGSTRQLIVAKRDRNGNVIRCPDVDGCIEHIKKYGIKSFTVDPFVETHEVEENSNAEIKAVAALYREIAQRADCAVTLVHHTSKPPEGRSDSHIGNMYSGRGASSLVGVARVSLTLFGMTERDAERLGVAPEDRRKYIRLDDAKMNLSLQSGEPAWFERAAQEIGNGKLGLQGDKVGVLRPKDFTAEAEAVAERQRNERSGLVEQIAEIIEAGGWRSTNALSKILVENGIYSSRQTAGREIEMAIPMAPGGAQTALGTLYRRRTNTGKTAVVEVVHAVRQ